MADFAQHSDTMAGKQSSTRYVQRELDFGSKLISSQASIGLGPNTDTKSGTRRSRDLVPWEGDETPVSLALGGIISCAAARAYEARSEIGSRIWREVAVAAGCSQTWAGGGEREEEASDAIW